ncbi:DUF6266 family protein [Parapedobacter deserti]|uniref:DUF6266 family protein n=1 Tax=Parapedobacter deserti TaxID=1912957 RepID=A0ABV7JJI7_9SPHI
MAKFINGANGTFSGKVGSVIGASWRGIHYLRGLSKKTKIPPTEAQVAQRLRFALVTKFLSPLLGILAVGFRNVRRLTAAQFSMAVKRNIEQAVIGAAPDFELDFSAITLSEGGLYIPLTSALEVAEGSITLSWDPAPNQFGGASNDVAYIVVYNAERQLFITTETPATRANGSAVVDVPAPFAGQQGHAWMFFASHDGKKVSATVYLGEITFQ